MYIKLTTNVIATKLRALYGKRLNFINYEQLINKHSISEIAYYLKTETYYKSTLESINENSIHRGQLELLVKIANFEKYIDFLHYKVSKGMDLFKYVVLKNELEEMLTAIRLFNTGRMERYALNLPVFLLKHTKMNLKNLVNVKQFDDLLKISKNTIYYKPLKMFMPKGKNDEFKIDVVRCEMELRKAFYNKVFSLMCDKNIDSRKFFLVNIEMFNITVIYRLIKFFSRSGQYIKSCLLPFFYYLDEKIIDQMVNASNIEELHKVVLKTEYAKYFAGNDISDIESFRNKFLYNMIKEDIRFITFPEHIMICYVYLMDIELKNIITIIECISYKFLPEEIKKLLII